MNGFKWSRTAVLSGVLFFVILVVQGAVDNNDLDDRATGRQVLDFFQAHKGAVQVSAALVILAVLVGMFFYAMLRDFLATDPENESLSRIAFGGALIFAASGGMSAGLNFELGHAAAQLDPSSALALAEAQLATSYLGYAGISLLMFASAWAILRSAVLPRWTGWMAVVVGVFALIPWVGFVAFFGVGIWTLCVSIAMYRRLGANEARVPARSVAVPA